MLTYDAQGDDEQRSLPHIDNGFHSKLPPGILPHGLPTMKEVASAITPLEYKKEPEEKNKVSEFFLSSLYINLTFVLSVKELSEEQKQMIILSADFQRFVLPAGRVIERALSENVDIYTEYIGGGDRSQTMRGHMLGCH